MKILYIEDNRTDAELTTRELTRAIPDCTIIHKSTLSEARKKLATHEDYDVVLVDMHLPDGNGLEILAEIREKNLPVAVIILTGSGDEESAAAALKAGADDYIVKKVGHPDLIPESVLLANKSFREISLRKTEEIFVLYVEHNQADIEFTIRHFNHYAPNFHITAVSSSKDALKELPLKPDQHSKYKILLLDYKLSGMNALDLVKIVRQERKLTLAIVMVTGQGNEEIVIQALRLGVDEYLVKHPNYLFRLPSLLRSAYQHHELECKQTELQKSESLYRLLANNSGDVIFILDMNLKYTFVSPAVFALRGYTPEEVLRQDLEDVLTPESLNRAKQLISKGMVPGEDQDRMIKEPQLMELEMLRKDGTKVWTEVKASVLVDGNNKPIGLLGVTRDISKRKKTELELIKAKEKAEESDRLKSAFLQNISHEIRTPMNAIVGFSVIINNPGLSSEKRKHYTDIIVQSSNQLLSIINDILSIATIETGQQKIEHEDTNINAICKMVFEQYFSKARDQNVSFRYKTMLSDNEADIETDKTKLLQVLVNVVGNALKFTQQGHVHFGYHLKNNFIEFYVEDTGKGIPDEMHEEIFVRFRQVDVTGISQYGGSGLGLSISKAYVELLGGKIWLVSKPGKGSVFYFTIPYHKSVPEKHSKKHPNRVSVIKLKKPLTLLVAEDENSNFILLEELLADINYTIIRARNGIEAIEICKSGTQIDLLLMDLKMPLMNGFEATRRIRKLMPHLPIIGLTAYTTDMDKNKALACGCNDVISKPIEQELLIAIMKEQLQNK
jgi:PAS domain S-box-containing protein